MQILDNHLLDEATQAPLKPGGGQMNVRRLLVIHFTSGASARSSVDYWKKLANGVCAHLVIDRDGTIIQCRPFNRTAGHAGKRGDARWSDPRTGTRYTAMNAISIGIELANAGNDAALAKRWTKLPLLKAAHRNGGKVQEWEQYPAAQLAACESVAKLLVKRYSLDDITGHDCIAPERKNDPGPAFPMQALREACGFTGLPQVFRP